MLSDCFEEYKGRWTDQLLTEKHKGEHNMPATAAKESKIISTKFALTTHFGLMLVTLRRKKRIALTGPWRNNVEKKISQYRMGYDG